MRHQVHSFLKPKGTGSFPLFLLLFQPKGNDHDYQILGKFLTQVNEDSLINCYQLIKEMEKGVGEECRKKSIEI
jgi:hypothetical protein